MPYIKGQSGNPAGRPKGARDKRTLIFEQLIPHGDQLISKAVEMALAGDSVMLKACLDKLIPNCKPVDRTATLDNLSGSLSQQGATVLTAIGDGQLTPPEGSTVISAIAAQAKLVEHDELLARIEALESNVTQKQAG